MYDSHDKRHISREQLATLIKKGEEVLIIDNTTGEDLTVSIVSQLIGLDEKNTDKSISPRLLMELLRKGSGTFTDYAKKYISLWQGAFNMAEDEIDKLVCRLVKNKELSNDEGSRLKNEIIGYTEGIKRWISDHVDKRVGEVLAALNLPTNDQMKTLSAKVDVLSKKVEQLEKDRKTSKRRPRKTAIAKKPPPKRQPKPAK